jgi:hypothetical protein
VAPAGMWAVLVSLLDWIHIIGVLRKDQALGFGDTFFMPPPSESSDTLISFLFGECVRFALLSYLIITFTAK